MSSSWAALKVLCISKICKNTLWLHPNPIQVLFIANLNSSPAARLKCFVCGLLDLNGKICFDATFHSYVRKTFTVSTIDKVSLYYGTEKNERTLIRTASSVELTNAYSETSSEINRLACTYSSLTNSLNYFVFIILIFFYSKVRKGNSLKCGFMKMTTMLWIHADVDSFIDQLPFLYLNVDFLNKNIINWDLRPPFNLSSREEKMLAIFYRLLRLIISVYISIWYN